MGPILLALFILYLLRPESFERIAIHASWALSMVSGRLERTAISREVRYLVMSSFIKDFAVREIPEIVVEWGDEDKAIMDLKAGKLVIFLKRGRRNRYENIARALISAIPDLLAPEMKAIYDDKILTCLSAHIARSIAKEYQAVVTAINETISALTEDDEELRKLASMLIEMDDRSLFSRILIPEMAKIAMMRYPHRDPSIDREVIEFIKILHKLARGEKIEEPIIYGKYFRVAFVLVARPEKSSTGAACKLC